MEAVKKRILVINGPNMNLLGMREPDLYGTVNLTELEQMMMAKADKIGAEIRFFQSNHEGCIIDEIHSAIGAADLLIINPAAYSHTSLAIRDAVAAVPFKVIEVHISNIFKRESFRKESLLSSVADGIIAGCGIQGYLMAMDLV